MGWKISFDLLKYRDPGVSVGVAVLTSPLSTMA